METWVKIRGSRHYSVSSKGRVRSDRYDRLIMPFLTARGVPTVQYRIGGRSLARTLSHLVAEAFLVGAKIHVKRVRHKDGDLNNCDFRNLEVVSYSIWE